MQYDKTVYNVIEQNHQSYSNHCSINLTPIERSIELYSKYIVNFT